MRTTTLFSTLRWKISIYILLLLLVTASVFSILTVRTMNRHILQEVLRRAESLCRSSAALVPYSMLSGDLLGMDNIVSKIKNANPDVEYAAVTNKDMTILAHTDVAQRGKKFEPAQGELTKEAGDGTEVYRVQSASDDQFEIRTPIVLRGNQMGFAILGINKSALLAARAEAQKRVMAGLAIVLLLGVGCILVLSSFITRPLKELARGVEELKNGRTAKLKIYSRDELGSLTRSFNQMTELITSQQSRLKAYARELEEAYVSTVKVLAAAIDARDPYTLGHSTRVAILSLRIGRTLKFTARELEDLEVACLFHDVGKLKTPDYVLLKEGKLDRREFEEMSRHSEEGALILSRASSLHKYIPAVRHHHERFDGKGYPDGLRGEDIPFHAAIIAVADAFDAMTSSRPYKKSRSREAAIQELKDCSGGQFHPRVVEVFLTIIGPQRLVTAEQASGRG